MTGSELRSLFLDFFKSKQHEIVPSSPLVTRNDPTLLFNNAGMNQFKDLFLGLEQKDYQRATTAQKCLRISGKHNDLENVGTTRRHHTFFEMMGNFSFGDYFKAEAIKYAWEFSTEVVKLDKQRLWVTIFEEDDEAGKLWTDLTDIDPSRILKMDATDNFWAMGDTGPCGPCSELHYYRGDDLKSQSEAEFRKDDGTYLEYWNLVFMQFNRDQNGELTELPKPSVDTGLGLERLISIVQDVPANYDIDLLRSIITKCEQLSGYAYDGTNYTASKDSEYIRDVAMRVIADHSRAISFLVAEGIIPGSEGRSYVLRRLIRRAVRHGRSLNFKDAFLKETTAEVIKLFGSQYPELNEQADVIARVVDAEERKFHETIDSGMQVLEKAIAKLGAGELFSGETAFLLHDTYGFPLDLTQDALKSHDIEVDTLAYDKAMDQQRERSRGDRKARKIEYSSIKVDADQTEFIGYEEHEAESVLQQVIAEEDQEFLLLFKETPFYAESGGQVADTGLIVFDDAQLEVLDVQKLQDKYFAHRVKLQDGTFSDSFIGKQAKLLVDLQRRTEIRKNHSATHLVHSGLRKFIGEHVKQAGSRVDHKSLRFDYSHFEAVTHEQLRDLQAYVNDQIQNNYEVDTQILSLEAAKAKGAMALFGEKYSDQVRVVQIGPDSLELCGGTHVSRSGDVGFCLLTSESSIAAGVRRIECIVGKQATTKIAELQNMSSELSQLLKCEASEFVEKYNKLNDRTRELEKQIDKLKTEQASSASSDFVEQARISPKGIKVIVETVANTDTKTLKTMVDRLRVKLGSGVVALGSSQGDKAFIVAGVTSDLVEQVNAGSLVKEASTIAGGRGGGRADFAQAGGLNPAELKNSLEALYELIA